MAEPKREELSVKLKRGILVRVLDRSQRRNREEALEEIHGLATTAGVQVVHEMIQVRPRPHPATCLGSGKVEELVDLIEAHEAQLVVFDNNLTPAQSRNLEEALQTIIVDRSEVILDIFATRAQTYEAKLQVELAQLLYFRPRLKRLWTHLERIEGGIGTGRGPGERQIETDRRLIDRRVSELRRRLKEVEGRRRREVSRRADHMTVSLVGYTNAGKSTLMQVLAGADVLIADKLFATLDTRTRRWDIAGWGEVLLSDTVGFVRDLPHHLVASFRSTLEEAREGDVLLHVIDASHAEWEEQSWVVNDVLADLDLAGTDKILVFNKVDRITHAEEEALRGRIRALEPTPAVFVSAHDDATLVSLKETLVARIRARLQEVVVRVPVEDGQTLAAIYREAEVIERADEGTGVLLTVRIPAPLLGRLRRLEGVHVQPVAAS